MSKRKILSLAMSLCVLAIVAIGGTLAYFTDTDNASNVFTVGDLSIELKEKAGITDQDGNEIKAPTGSEDEGWKYEDVKPGYFMQKEPTITNDGDYDAYVRIAVKVNNMVKINQAIDDVYENIEGGNVQAKINEVFEGWGLNYERDGKTGRMWMTKPTFEGVDVYGVDMYMKRQQSPEEGGRIFANTRYSNLFQNDADKELSDRGVIYGEGYYHNKIGLEDRLYVYYVKMPAGKSVTLFKGVNVPADFDNHRAAGKKGEINQMAMFDGLNIDIKVAAIQTEGFADEMAAFTQLEKDYPLQF